MHGKYVTWQCELSHLILLVTLDTGNFNFSNKQGKHLLYFPFFNK